MDKRYQVFVSSTFVDLVEERKEVMQALLELDCIPAGMELFPAANESQWTLIKRVIDDCDYYIVILGGRYGSLGPEGLSYTQMEYEYAITTNKPVIAFYHSDPGSIAASKTEKSAEGKAKLEAFLKLVQQKLCKPWTTPSDLGSVVSRSLVRLIKDYPAIGWVKADLLPDRGATEEILLLRKHIEALQRQLKEAEVTSGKDTEQLAQGEDTVSLSFEFDLYDVSDNTVYTHKDNVDVSWNDIFKRISPLLIDEISDLNFKKSLEQWIAEKNGRRLAGELNSQGYQPKNFKLILDDFNTIKVQLLALKLMERSVKRKTRSVNDRAAYWSLTPHGESAMMTLRALKKPAPPEPSTPRRRRRLS